MQEPLRNVLELKGSKVASVEQGDTVLRAVDRMNELRIGAVIVVHESRTVGIFTERDVLTRVIARNLSPDRTIIGEVMTRELLTVSESDTVMDAMMKMTDKRCRHLPVMRGETLVGLVSIGDLTSWVVRDQERTIAELHDYLHRS
jgi:CBS domain-containing protein